jgi:hypothetical protein
MPIRGTRLRDKGEIVFGSKFARGLKLAIKGCASSGVLLIQA